ncbi:MULTISPECIES: recombinase family protein [unclassified Streptomyces]|uniref:recombinase family protein n=1 Tax=unclassified Streptomyces TaxID=2593676 RepID=UPI0033BAB139
MSSPSIAVGSSGVPVASYARTSEDFRKGDAHGVNSQHRINERSAREQGCVIVARYTDNGRNASKPGCSRPAFDRLLLDLRRGTVGGGMPLGGIVCVADDRLYRRVEDFARFIEALTSHPGRIHVDQSGVRNPYTKEGLLQAVLSLEAAVAETEIRAQRVRNWHWSRAMDGIPHSGPRPFGWADDRITLHPVEAELVRKAIEDRIGGMSVNAIAREWYRLGVTGTRGGVHNPQTVTQIMTAPRVCGYRANRGELLLDPDTRLPVVGQWEPIVSPEQWEALCATFAAGSLYMHRGSGAPRRTGEKAGPRYLASGFLRCGGETNPGQVCGRKMGGSKSGRSRRSPYNYICNGAAGRGCGRCAISGPLVDDAIERFLFPEGGRGPVRLPQSIRERWKSGAMDFDERRKVIASVFEYLVIRPGVKGNRTWDYSRVSPVWKWADRVVASDPAA